MSVPRYSLSQLASDWTADVDAFVRHGLTARPGLRGRVQWLSAALMPNLALCLSYRISHWIYCHRLPVLAASVARLANVASGASISPASELGGGLYVPHPAGVAIQARAGPGLRVYAAASICCSPPRPLDGRPLPDPPRLGSEVVVGAEAVVAGPLSIGDAAVVSFRAVPFGDIPSGRSAHSNPLRNYRVQSSLEVPP